MNAKIIEGLKAVRGGIDLILEGYEEDKIVSTSAKEVAPVKAEQKEEPKTEAKKEAPVVASDKTYTREQLDGMTYNNIKKLAKDLGISAVGNREEITNRILGDAPVEDEKTEEAPVEVPVDEKDNDPVYAKVIATVADMSNEEIADVLADIGVSAKGKREALIDKVVQAVKDGLLELDDDEESEDEEAPEQTTPTEKVAEQSADDEEEDNTNDVDNPNMTEARKKAILAQDDEIRKQFKSKDVTRADLVEFLQTFYDTEEPMDDMTDDDLLDTYIDAVCRLVDDDGNLVEEGAYLLNGEPACCGRPLTYSEDTKMFICEHCGEEYEAEE